MNKDVEQALRKSVYQMLADNPEVDLSPDGGRWDIYSHVGISVDGLTGEDRAHLWEDLYVYVKSLVAATNAYHQAQAEVNRMNE
jgi:hypothetical protein